MSRRVGFRLIYLDGSTEDVRAEHISRHNGVITFVAPGGGKMGITRFEAALRGYDEIREERR